MILQLTRLASDAHAQSRKLDRAQFLDDRLQPIVPAGRPARPHPQASQWEVRVVDDDEHIRRPELVKRAISRTAQPLRFMNVVGSASSIPSPISATFAARAFHFACAFNVTR